MAKAEMAKASVRTYLIEIDDGTTYGMGRRIVRADNEVDALLKLLQAHRPITIYSIKIKEVIDEEAGRE